MTEHTPTPWHVLGEEAYLPGIESNNGEMIVMYNVIKPGNEAGVHGSTPNIGRVNAAFIVESVNNHEALKARVAELEQHLHSLLEMPIVCNVHNGVIENYKRRKAARAALREKGEK